MVAIANSAARKKNTCRQPKKSPRTPPAAWPNNWPRICPDRKVPSTCWRRSYGMTSPRKAIASGMIQPADRPHASRAATSAGSDPASPHRSTSTVDIAAEAVTQAYFPKRSPTGPMMSCTEPCVGGDHDRGGTDADAHVGSDLRQQGVRDPHHGLAGERGERKERNRAGRAAARNWQFGRQS